MRKMRIHLLITILAFPLSYSAHVGRYSCAVDIKGMRYIPDEKLMCGVLQFESPTFDYHNQYVILPDLHVKVQISDNGTLHDLTLSNDGCHELGNIGYITDYHDLRGHKRAVYVCAPYSASSVNGENLEFHDHFTRLMDGVLHMKADQTYIIRCPVTKYPALKIQVYSILVNQTDVSDKVTCASLAVGDGGEVVQPNGHKRIVDDLVISKPVIWSIQETRALCVEFDMKFSKDIAKFYLHEDSSIMLSSKEIEEIIPFDNAMCVSTVSNYIRDSPHTMWRNPVFMCTPERPLYPQATDSPRSVLASPGTSHVFGNLTYVITTQSGHRLIYSKSIMHKFKSPGQTLKHMNRYCHLDTVKEQCQECRISCRAAIEGTGYLYCKNGWTYIADATKSQRPLFIPFTDDNMGNSTELQITPHSDDDQGSLHESLRHSGWVVIFAIALFCIMMGICIIYRIRNKSGIPHVFYN
jgi:hypothetical protein